MLLSYLKLLMVSPKIKLKFLSLIYMPSLACPSALVPATNDLSLSKKKLGSITPSRCQLVYCFGIHAVLYFTLEGTSMLSTSSPRIKFFKVNDVHH